MPDPIFKVWFSVPLWKFITNKVPVSNFTWITKQFTLQETFSIWNVPTLHCVNKVMVTIFRYTFTPIFKCLSFQPHNFFCVIRLIFGYGTKISNTFKNSSKAVELEQSKWAPFIIAFLAGFHIDRLVWPFYNSVIRIATLHKSDYTMTEENYGKSIGAWVFGLGFVVNLCSLFRLHTTSPSILVSPSEMPLFRKCSTFRKFCQIYPLQKNMTIPIFRIFFKHFKSSEVLSLSHNTIVVTPLKL